MIPAGGMSVSAASSAKSGDAYSSASMTSGDITFGGSGMGGSTTGNGLNVGSMISQYWPLFAAAGAIWYFRKKWSN